MTEQIPNVATASLQEIFDFVVSNLLKQNAKSVSEEHPDECLYRGPNGKKCAAGFLISDSRYSKSLEGQNIYYIINAIMPDFDSNNSEHFSKRALIVNLQEIHDEIDEEDWKEAFKRLAKITKLSINFS